MGKLGAIPHIVVGLMQRLSVPVTKEHFSSLVLNTEKSGGAEVGRMASLLLETLLK